MFRRRRNAWQPERSAATRDLASRSGLPASTLAGRQLWRRPRARGRRENRVPAPRARSRAWFSGAATPGNRKGVSFAAATLRLAAPRSSSSPRRLSDVASRSGLPACGARGEPGLARAGALGEDAKTAFRRRGPVRARAWFSGGATIGNRNSAPREATSFLRS